MKKLNWIAALTISTLILFIGCAGNESKNKDTNASNNSVKIEDQEININTSESVVQWKGSMVGIYDHTGTLKFKEGSLKIKNGSITSGSFVVDMNSMVATDENYNPEEGSTKDKLIGHLSSADFFDVENFPTASFTIKNYVDGTIKGDLTVRGISHEETVKNVTINKDGNKVVFEGELVFDRQKYDVAWAHPMKDKVLKDNIELKIILK